MTDKESNITLRVTQEHVWELIMIIILTFNSEDTPSFTTYYALEGNKKGGGGWKKCAKGRQEREGGAAISWLRHLTALPRPLATHKRPHDKHMPRGNNSQYKV